ncbi:hypothetical protein [Glaciihabitans sp. UYNi722]|uniref:hypothetical protein n=1 Tax=Glaciihabitans sp. UYNi722 TaxID=3156344 RepID=UPI003397B0DA
MSHTSTEAEARRRRLPFRRALAVTIAVLIALVAVFAGLNYLQGPKLSGATVDTKSVVANPGQQLRLFANQNLSKVKKSQVAIAPAVPFSVSASGEIIALQFEQRLRYDSDYRVTVDGVRSLYQDRPQTFHYSFTTAKAEFYYLDRADPSVGSDQLDAIVRTGLSGSDRTVVYSAPHIQEFTVFPQLVAVAALNDDNTSSLSLVSFSGGPVEKMNLPGPGTISRLEAAPDAGMLGFLFTGAGSGESYSNDLMLADLTGTHLVQPVLGLDSQPLAVIDWQFLNGSTSFVAQTLDQTVLLIDSKKPTTSVPLGQYSELGRSTPDGTTLVVGDVFGRIAYSLGDGSETRLPPLPLAGAETFGGSLELLGSGDARVQQVAVLDTSGGKSYRSYLVYEKGASSRILFQTVNNKGSIDGFSISPNGQYVAVNIVPDVATSVSDGYAVNPKSTSITTAFVDIATGKLVRSVSGFDESW